MTTMTCPHPTCDVPLQRNRCCCPRHWYALPEELRQRFSKAGRNSEAQGVIRIEIREYLEGRMIGNNEIVRCRGEECGEDVVFLFTHRGVKIPVQPDTVQPGDATFDPDRHTSHFAACKDAARFRKEPAV